MAFSRATCWMLHSGHDNLRQQYKRGEGWRRLPDRKGSGGVGLKPAECDPAVCPGTQEVQRCPVLHQK